MATPGQRTPDTPAARAMAIIEAAQTAAASARRPGGPRPTIAPSAPAPRPATARPVAAPAPSVADPQAAQILALVERVRAETRQATGRLDRLAASIDDLERARRTAAPVASPAPAASPVPAVGPASRPAPASPAAAAVHRPAPSPAAAHRPAPSPAAASAPAVSARPSPDTVSDTARIVALDLAATGLGRAEVGVRLERDYGVTNVAAVLDAAFGRRR